MYIYIRVYEHDICEIQCDRPPSCDDVVYIYSKFQISTIIIDVYIVHIHCGAMGWAAIRTKIYDSSVRI